MKEYYLDYQLDKLRPGSIKSFIDIGANDGDVCCYVQRHHPTALVVALEPCKSTFAELVKNVGDTGIHVENKAFGDGDMFTMTIRNPGKSVTHLCDKKAHGNQFGVKQHGNYRVKSVMLPWIVDTYNIETTKGLVIKSDCEGGERYFIGSKRSEDIIRDCMQFSLEVHFQAPDTPYDFWLPWETYNTWVYDSFSSTHYVSYYKSSKKGGYGHYLLWNKQVPR